MSEKYTIVHGDVCYKDSGNHFNIVSAEWICRVLNEEEKRKSLPKSDTDMKVQKEKIDFLIKHFKHSVEKKLHVDNQEIIELLEDLKK